MALNITAVPDCQSAMGPSQFAKAFQLEPGAISDYPAGGYQINASALGLGNLYGAWKISANAAAAAYGVDFVLPSYPATPEAQASINLYVTSGGNQVAANTNLSGCVWIAEFLAGAE